MQAPSSFEGSLALATTAQKYVQQEQTSAPTMRDFDKIALE